jgi:hypothetical protein
MTGIAKIVRQVNVLCASYALLVCIGVASGCRWAGSPPPRPHPPITFLELAVGALVLCWLAGAVALFYRKRLAWVASLVGAGALACAFAAIWVSMARFYVHPIDEELKLLRGMDVSAGSVIALGVLFALFALCLALFIGLLWTRKDFRPI